MAIRSAMTCFLFLLASSCVPEFKAAKLETQTSSVKAPSEDSRLGSRIGDSHDVRDDINYGEIIVPVDRINAECSSLAKFYLDGNNYPSKSSPRVTDFIARADYGSSIAHNLDVNEINELTKNDPMVYNSNSFTLSAVNAGFNHAKILAEKSLDKHEGKSNFEIVKRRSDSAVSFEKRWGFRWGSTIYRLDELFYEVLYMYFVFDNRNNIRDGESEDVYEVIHASKKIEINPITQSCYLDKGIRFLLPCKDIGEPVVKFSRGQKNITVPNDANFVEVKLWGGGGWNASGNHQISYGGPGGFTKAELEVDSGQKLSILVGYNRYNGFGGRSGSGNSAGGGLSGLFTGHSTIKANSKDRAMAVAGGGGGANYSSDLKKHVYGGPGNYNLYSGGESTMAGESARSGPDGKSSGGGGYEGGSINSSSGRGHTGNGGMGYISSDYGNCSANSSQGAFVSSALGSKNAPMETDSDYTYQVGAGRPQKAGMAILRFKRCSCDQR